MKVILDIVGPDGRDPTPQHFDDHIAALQNASGIDEVRRADIISIFRGLRWVLQNELMNETFNKPSVADRWKPPLKLVRGSCASKYLDGTHVFLQFRVGHLIAKLPARGFSETIRSLLRDIENKHGLRLPSDDLRRYVLSGGVTEVTLEYSGPAFPCVIEGENVWPIRSPVSIGTTTPAEGTPE